MSDELKACGHCGSCEVIGDSQPYGGHPILTTERLRCARCGTRTGWMDTKRAAIAAWNRRVVTREQVEKMARHAWLPAGDVPQQYVTQVADMLRAAGFEVAA